METNNKLKTSCTGNLPTWQFESHSTLNDRKYEVEDEDETYLSADLMKNKTVAARLADKFHFLEVVGALMLLIVCDNLFF